MQTTARWTIRAAVAEDLEKVVTMCGEHAAYELVPWTSEGKRDRLAAALFADPPRVYCLVADLGGELAAYATYTFDYSTWRAAPFLYLDCLYVKKPYRSAGIGRDLMSALSREARSLGCSMMEWQTPRWNERAAKFYERLGATSQEKLRFFLDQSVSSG